MAAKKEPQTLKGKEAAEAMRFQHTCYLAANMEQLSNANKGHVYKHFVSMDCTPPALIEKLNSVPGAEAFINAPPIVLSSLVPMIKVFKVYYADEKDKGQDRELKFTDSLSGETISALSTMTESAASRGQGVGLKSFEWTLSGQHPGESNASIEAKMVMLFSSVQDLEAEQTCTINSGGKTESVTTKWKDLISPPRTHNKGGGWNNRFFRIKVQLGYYPPNENMWSEFPKAEEYKKAVRAIKDAQTVLFLNLVGHEISFTETGQIELSLDYQAQLEGVFSDPRADIFLLGDEPDEDGNPSTMGFDKAEAEKAQKIRGKIGDADRCKTDSTEKKVKSANKKRQKDIDKITKDRKSARAAKYQKILAIMDGAQRVFSVEIDEEKVGQLKNKMQLSNSAMAERRTREPDNGSLVITENPKPKEGLGHLGNVSKNAAEATKSKDQKGLDKNIKEAKQHAAKVDADQIDFFYFGDLLDIALSVLKPMPAGCNADPPGEIRPIVLPYVYSDPFGATGSPPVIPELSVNLADIPISLESFKVWFVDNVVKTSRNTYPAKHFIDDVITGLIANAFTPKCFGKDSRGQIPQVQQTIITADLADGGKDRITGIGPTSREFFGRIPSIDSVKIKGTSDKGFDKTNYYIISTASSASASLRAYSMEGGKIKASLEKENAADGRYWLRFGTDVGLVKEIKFNKQDQPGMREARMEQYGTGGLSHLREIYDVDVTMYGCPIFHTGMYIYVDPSSAGIGQPTAIRDLAMDLGIGGYYMIIEVSNAIESGKFETQLKTVFAGYGMGEPYPEEQEDGCKKKKSTTATPVADPPPKAPAVSQE